MDPYGSDRHRARARLSPSALAAFARHLELQSSLPKSGGLIGSGWAQFRTNAKAPNQALGGRVEARVARLPPPALRAAFANGIPVAASAPGRWSMPVPSCSSCHGPRQPPAPPASPPRPPADDPWTYYPDPSLRKGGGWGRASGGSGDEPKQCTMQDRRDGVICSQQRGPTPELTAEARAVCQESRSKRYAHCLATREVGEPQLKTYKRWQGEPPIRRWKPKPKPRLR
jgi:hypothetical protein